MGMFGCKMFERCSHWLLVAVVCFPQSGCGAPQSPYASGLDLTNKMRDLARAGKIDEAARLLPAVEALPKEAMVQPDNEAPRVLDNDTEDMVPDPGHLATAIDAAASAFDEQDRYELSERLLTKAISAEGRTPDLLRHMGTVYAAQGKKREAEQIDKELHLIERSSHSVYHSYPILRYAHDQAFALQSKVGTTRLAEKKYREAEDAFRLASEGFNEDTGRQYNSPLPEALRGLGKAQYLQGKYRDACRTFRRVVELVKEAPGDWLQNGYIRQDLLDYAKVLRKVGDVKEAETVEADAARLPPVPDAGQYRNDHHYDLD